MKILVVGAGATGGYFGACLAAAGRDVTFLVRERRAAFLERRGLRVVGGRRELRVAPKVTTAGHLGGKFDVVLLTVKAAGLAGAIADLAPAVGPNTVIVPFMNGMAHMEELGAAFGAGKVLGSTVHLVGTINGDGDIAILNPLARWTLGEPEGGTSGRLEALLAEVSVPGIEVVSAENGLAAMWDKWAFIVAAGVVTCLMRGTVGDIAAVPGGTGFVAAVVAETCEVAAAAGFAVPDAERANTLAFLSAPGSAFTSSLYRDVTAGLPNEAEHIVGDFAARAAALEVSVPLTNLALLQLRVHEVAAGRG